MNITLRCPDAVFVADHFLLNQAELKIGTDRAVVQFGALLLTKVKANASGRPGPNTVTGDYRRSWSVKYSSGVGGRVASVGTNKPQGRRLEFGFVGVDSLGRVYDQPPFPHVQPAADEIEPQFLGTIEALLIGLK